jgi:YidC/Oxa1 family membrane protein insertase
MQKETMALYKKYKVNPVGGCLPMFLQIPVFIALYNVLLTAIELRGAPWAFWITDLSVKDPYYVLPIVMGLTMVLQQKMTPSAMDPKQAKMMMLMPIVFTFMFLSFASGLVLYWLVNNVLGIVQQYFVNKKAD